VKAFLLALVILAALDTLADDSKTVSYKRAPRGNSAQVLI